MAVDYQRFQNLTFDDFRRLARDPTLSRHEKVGFPDAYREGRETAIFSDIRAKLTNLERPGGTVLEIGPGCSRLPVMLAGLCKKNRARLIWVDSEEMLEHLPREDHITRCYGTFPEALRGQFKTLAGSVDVILAYSVIQYVFVEGKLWEFVDRCLSLLREGGQVLFGDVPNTSMRKRFLASQAGQEFQRGFSGGERVPAAGFSQPDDSVVLAILSRVRAQGFHAWVVPQDPALPMANRREDILISKP